ncbi:MAG: glutamyl-tRNA reductase [Acidobacteriaceae bacterium]|jgi:glutamyl-tRNA reductase|nr:glutamyl-tRNA reductase [Acidobacteriaceae bacterium]
MKLVLLGINHKTAPVEVRERLAIPATRLADATRTLAHQPGVREGMILSTCNRVELVTAQEGGEETQSADLLSFLNQYFALPPAMVEPHLYEYREREAVRHLFRVASSLDSMVVGEPQILGQVKAAYTAAREVGAVQHELEGLLQRTFAVAKKVRHETQIGATSVSIASVAVELAQKIFGSLDGKTVLLVGAGKMSELAARHLVQQGAATVLVANRTYERAVEMATRFGGKAVPFESVYAHAATADIVITSTGSPEPIFRPEHGRQFLQARKNRPMFFIDIAVPRDVDPQMNKLEGIFVYDIDDLQSVAASNMAERSKEAQAAESIVSREVDRFQQRIQSLDAVQTVVALQQSAEQMRAAEMLRVRSKLSGLNEEQAAAVEALTRGLMKKFLHSPLSAVKQAAQEGDAEALRILRKGFHLEEPGE